MIFEVKFHFFDFFLGAANAITSGISDVFVHIHFF